MLRIVGDEFMGPFRARIKLGLVTFALLMAACGAGPPPPAWKGILDEAKKSEESSLPTTPVKTTDKLVVYLDTSGSMAGYASADGNSTYGKTLRKLRELTGTFNKPEVEVKVRYVDTKVGPVMPAEELIAASQKPGLYTGKETNLVGAVNYFAHGVNYAEPSSTGVKQQNGEPGAAPEEEAPPRFSVLVTDGVQSTKNNNSVSGCTAGSDEFCVRKRIKELLKQGWNGCVLGLRSEFKGTVYSEATGAKIPYQSSSSAESFRPFYILLFSPDRTDLDQLVQWVKEGLRPLVAPDNPLRELNLTFPYADDTTTAEMQIPKDSASALQRGKIEPGNPVRMTLLVDVDETARSGAKSFNLAVKIPWTKHATDTATAEELVKALRWQPTIVYPAKPDEKNDRFANLEVKGQTVGPDGTVNLELSAGWDRDSKSPAWRVYRLEAKLDLDRNPAWTPGWIENWTTDNDATKEVANRTYNLKLALSNLWNNEALKQQMVAKIYLRVGPP